MLPSCLGVHKKCCSQASSNESVVQKKHLRWPKKTKDSSERIITPKPQKRSRFAATYAAAINPGPFLALMFPTMIIRPITAQRAHASPPRPLQQTPLSSAPLTTLHAGSCIVAIYNVFEANVRRKKSDGKEQERKGE